MMGSDQKIKELVENFRSLSVSEKEQFRSVLGDEWFKTRSLEEHQTIKTLLDKSRKQFEQGEGKLSENIVNDSRKKYGI